MFEYDVDQSVSNIFAFCGLITGMFLLFTRLGFIYKILLRRDLLPRIRKVLDKFFSFERSHQSFH